MLARNTYRTANIMTINDIKSGDKLIKSNVFNSSMTSAIEVKSISLKRIVCQEIGDLKRIMYFTYKEFKYMIDNGRIRPM